MTYIRELFAAFESGFRAGRKQYRRMRSMQRARLIDAAF